MRLRSAIILFLLVGLVLGIVGYFIWDHVAPKEIITMKFDVHISNEKSGGFNLDTDKLHFGILSPQGFSNRKFTLHNQHNFDERIEVVIVSYNSEIANYVYISPTANTIIPKNKTEQFTISLFAHEKISLGGHYGHITIRTYKVWPWETKKINLPAKFTDCFSSKSMISLIQKCHTA